MRTLANVKTATALDNVDSVLRSLHLLKETRRVKFGLEADIDCIDCEGVCIVYVGREESMYSCQYLGLLFDSSLLSYNWQMRDIEFATLRLSIYWNVKSRRFEEARRAWKRLFHCYPDKIVQFVSNTFWCVALLVYNKTGHYNLLNSSLGTLLAQYFADEIILFYKLQ